MRRLRIAVVVPGYAADAADHGLPAVADHLEHLGRTCDVTVLALRHPSRRPAWRMGSVEVHALGLGRAGGPRGRAEVLLGGIRAVLALHRRAPLDVVHGLWCDEPGAVAAVGGRLIRRPSVVSLMGGELVALPDIGYGAALGLGGRWTAALALRLASVTTAASSAGRAALAARRRGVEPMPLGVDIGDFRPPGPDDARRQDAPVILFCGSLEAVKDPEFVLRAVALLAPARPGLRLEFVGDGGLRPHLERLATELGLEARVHFLGNLPRSELAGRYRSATLLAVTSRHEAQSMVAVEAAASGIPVVGTAVGILPDLGEGALTVADRTPATLAAGLASVLDDPAVAARMGAAARRAAEDRFGLPATVDSALALYARLVARR